MPVRPVFRVWFVFRAGRFRVMQARPTDRPTVKVVGRDPIRVLVTGAGLAAGYGVDRHERTLAGSLARELAARTGRGVVIDVRSAPLLPASGVVRHVGPNGTHTYDAAVFTPCYLEATFAPGAGMPRHGAAIQRHLLDTGRPTLQLVMLGVPRPSLHSGLDDAAAEAAGEVNAALQRLADGEPRVSYVDPPEFSSVRANRPFDEPYYAELGSRVADELSTAL